LEISDFVSHFLHDFHSAQRYILCLSPESETFISYTNIIPYSLNRAYFTSNYFKIDVPLHKIVNQYSKPFAFYESWIESSENWLYFLPLQKNSMKNYFLQYLYRHHIHPLNLPPEVGVPVPNMEILKTPPIVWQAYIWLHFLYKNEQESVFSINDLERYVFHTMKKSIIFRNTIHISRKNRLQPILNYLDLLCKLQMIKRQEGYFIINKKANLIDHPNTMREGLRKDFFRKYKAVIINNLVLTDK
jgi:competence CoiA-like predicted nuclease